MNFVDIETFIVCLVFAGAFVTGGRLHRPNSRLRNVPSFSAGASVAYIFIHLAPELEKANEVFAREMDHLGHPFIGQGINIATLAGFIFFYGLEQAIMGIKKRKGETAQMLEREKNVLGFRLSLAAFGLYALLVSYLLLHSLEEGEVRLGLYALAMGFHFLSVGHSLQQEYGSLYRHRGAPLLGLCSLGGWAAGKLIMIPVSAIAVLLGLIAGGVIVNTMIMELPREKEGHFLPFLAGALSYSIMLLFLG